MNKLFNRTLFITLLISSMHGTLVQATTPTAPPLIKAKPGLLSLNNVALACGALASAFLIGTWLNKTYFMSDGKLLAKAENLTANANDCYQACILGYKNELELITTKTEDSEIITHIKKIIDSKQFLRLPLVAYVSCIRSDTFDLDAYRRNLSDIKTTLVERKFNIIHSKKIKQAEKEVLLANFNLMLAKIAHQNSLIDDLLKQMNVIKCYVVSCDEYQQEYTVDRLETIEAQLQRLQVQQQQIQMQTIYCPHLHYYQPVLPNQPPVYF